MSVNQRLNFGFGRLHENQTPESLLVDYKIGIGILEVYLTGYVTSQARLFTNNKKLQSLFSLKNKNLMNDNIKETSLELKNLIS